MCEKWLLNLFVSKLIASCFLINSVPNKFKLKKKQQRQLAYPRPQTNYITKNGKNKSKKKHTNYHQMFTTWLSIGLESNYNYKCIVITHTYAFKAQGDLNLFLISFFFPFFSFFFPFLFFYQRPKYGIIQYQTHFCPSISIFFFILHMRNSLKYLINFKDRIIV